MEQDYVKLREIKPVLSGYIRAAQFLLKKADVPDEKTVHDVRVLMKKSRALLKLVKPQLTDGYNERDIAALREVGRIMRNWRETSVHRKTIKDFRKKFPDILSRLTDNAKLNSILEKPATVAEVTPAQREALEQINDLLAKTSYRIRFQAMNTLDPQALLKELDLSYGKVVDIYISSRNKMKPASVHEFRKEAKDFLYQLNIFKPLNPSVVKTLEKKIDSLTANLGKFNDISQLIIFLDYDYREESNSPPMDELIIKFREAQDAYLAKVWPTAYQVFCPGQKLVNVLGFKLLLI